MKKILLLNSGGVDSALLAEKLSNDGFEVISLFVDFDLPNTEPTQKAAEITAKKYCARHIVHTERFSVPKTDKKSRSVEDQSLLLMTLGAIYARRLGCREVYSGTDGTHSEDWGEKLRSVYGDTMVVRERPVFMTPFIPNIPRSKTEHSWTYSCREKQPCGKCDKCQKYSSH